MEQQRLAMEQQMQQYYLQMQQIMVVQQRQVALDMAPTPPIPVTDYTASTTTASTTHNRCHTVASHQVAIPELKKY